MASSLLKAFIKKAVSEKKQPNYGKFKAKLSSKVREGKASKEEKDTLKQLRDMDKEATMSQKIKQSRSASKKPVSLAGSPKVGGTVNKKEGGKVSKPKGCGAATRGYGKAMKGSK